MTTPHNRASERMRVLRTGKIAWDNATRSVDCKVRELSETGALVELLGPVILPDTFDLNMPPSKELRPVKVMRRAGTTLGLMFMDIALAGSGKNKEDTEEAVMRYDPKDDDHCLYIPMTSTIRDMLPWQANS